MIRPALSLSIAIALAGCATTPPPVAKAAQPAEPVRAIDANPFPSTYRAPVVGKVALVGGNVLTATGAEIADGTVLMAVIGSRPGRYSADPPAVRTAFDAAPARTSLAGCTAIPGHALR